MKNLFLLLILIYSVGSQAQDVDLGALFLESLENLEAGLRKTSGCSFTDEDGQVTYSSDDEGECDQVKSQAKKSLGKFKRAVRDNFRDNLDLSFQRMCPSIFSSGPEGVPSRPSPIRPEWGWGLDIGRVKYNISRQEFKCRVLDLKLIRDLGLGSTIGEDTQQLLCCEMGVTVKTKDFSEYVVEGHIGAGLEVFRGEEFKAGLEVRGESSFESSSGETGSRGFIGLGVSFSK